jgi:hypothetical protein
MEAKIWEGKGLHGPWKENFPQIKKKNWGWEWECFEH